MEKRIPGWVKICGIGCGALLLIVVALVVGSTFFVRNALQEFEAADRTMEDVSEQFGPISEYRPDPGGAIPPDRVEAFLQARESVASVREATERSLAVLSGGGALRRIGAGVGILHRLAEFSAAHSQALIDAGMGQGEYYYIYSLVYFSWLGKSPDEGPSFQAVGDRGYYLESLEPQDESEVRAHRDELVRASLNRVLLPLLRNQLADLEAEDAGEGPDGWREALTDEIAAMEADSARLPWVEGLPEIIASSLSPYRERLDASFSPMCNALEVGVARR